MSIYEEINERIYKRTKRRVNVYPNMGFDNLRKMVGEKQVNMTSPKDDTLTDTMKRRMANKADIDDPKNALLFPEERKVCTSCGKALTDKQITHGERRCDECRNKKQDENKLQMMRKQVEAEYASSNLACVNTTPQPTVTLLSEEEQKDLAKNMCVVSTIRDLMEHSPNRPIMFVHIENYSPTINNYSSETH